MPLNACIHDSCSNATAPGSVYCPGHHYEAMATAAGVSEPEVEAAVRAVRSEDDLHPGMRKVYDRETGKPSWVPVESGIDAASQAGPLPVGPRIGPFPGEPYTESRMEVTDAVIREVAGGDDYPAPGPGPEIYVRACLAGEHGIMRKNLAESMMEAAEWVLRKL